MLTIGPGRFTGVRLSLSVVQALSFAKQIPVVALNTLECLAWQAIQKYKLQQVVVLMDAKMGEVYLGHFAVQDGLLQQIQSPSLLKPEMILQHYLQNQDNIIYLGDAWQSFPQLRPLLNRQADPYPPEIAPEAMFCLAAQYLQRGEVIKSGEELKPCYLRTASAWV